MKNVTIWTNICIREYFIELWFSTSVIEMYVYLINLGSQDQHFNMPEIISAFPPPDAIIFTNVWCIFRQQTSRYLQHKRDTLQRHADVRAGFTTPALILPFHSRTLYLPYIFSAIRVLFLLITEVYYWFSNSLRKTFFRDKPTAKVNEWRHEWDLSRKCIYKFIIK